MNGTGEHDHLDDDSFRRSELIEQVMRMTDDDRDVLPFLDCEAGSGQLLAATGRLLAGGTEKVTIGTPLYRWVTDGAGAIEPGWRQLLPDVETSLWDELTLLRQLVAPVPRQVGPCCPYSELEMLRLNAFTEQG